MIGVFRSGKISTGIRATARTAPSTTATIPTIIVIGCRIAKIIGFMATPHAALNLVSWLQPAKAGTPTIANSLSQTRQESHSLGCLAHVGLPQRFHLALHGNLHALQRTV